MFDSQNNYRNKVSSLIVYHKNKPILEIDFFLWRKSKYLILESNSIIRYLSPITKNILLYAHKT
jgi:hypothetical protein